MRARTSSMAAAALVTLVACGGHPRPSARQAPPAPEPWPVSTAAVVRKPVGATVAAPAVVQARRRAALASRLSASVIALPYREGDPVPAGAVVAQLDDAALRGALAAAEAAAAAAEADLARAQTLLAKGAATPRELEQATAAAGAARAQTTSARDNLAYATLRAPFGGRLAARHVNVGDVVGPGRPLVEIDGESGLELKASVDLALAAGVTPGRRLHAVVDGQSAAPPLAVTVTAVTPGADPLTHRIEVKADLPAAAGLRAGQFARLLLPGAAAESALHVPAAALFERGGLHGVFVVGEGRARLRWVAAGVPDGTDVEIRAGVEEGEEVVLRPGGLQDGWPVRAR
jgi:RND family efflux transporter MFP subunit